MKSILIKTVTSLLFILIFPAAKTQTVEWKHYEYNDINLQFDLPADFTFDYPDEGGIAFTGHNAWVTFIFKQISIGIFTDEERKAELYRQGGFTGDYSADVNFMSGLSTNGYNGAGTHCNLNNGDDAVMFLYSDPKNAYLNFLITISYGGEENTNEVAYTMASNIINKFGPIKK